MFTFGIEHEVAFLDSSGRFVDYRSPTSYEDFSAIIALLPRYPEDYPGLLLGDAGIRVKRWYLEGLERFDAQGNLLTCLSKGIEIRTSLHSTIRGAVTELSASFALLRTTALEAGFTPVLTSFHPYRTRFIPDPPFNAYEQGLLDKSPEDTTALLSMLTYGPDLSFSIKDLSQDQLIDLGRKLTCYSPAIVAFTGSSPFYAGRLWEGLSVRTFLRTGLRPSVLVFLDPAAQMINSNPSLTKRARIPAEVGRIEFKACESCDNFQHYAALLALLKGLALDTTLSGRLTVPDAGLHQQAARLGLKHPDLARSARCLLEAARAALAGDEDLQLLTPLYDLLDNYNTPASKQSEIYRETGSIELALRQSYLEFAD